MDTTLDAPSGGANPYAYDSGLTLATKRFFNNYTNFSGRSNRGDYWWLALAVIVITIGIVILDAILASIGIPPLLNVVWILAIFIPSIALGVRRLHDINKSGWWLLISFVPLVGSILLLVWFCKAPDPQPNNFG